MPVHKKSITKERLNLYIDKQLRRWIAEEASKMAMSETAYARLLLITAYQNKTTFEAT